MKVAYASRTGNIESVVNALGLDDAVKIVDGTESIDGDYIIFTYTDGAGITPSIVEDFLAANPGVKGVVSSGNSDRHAETFNFASKNIAEAYGVPIIAQLEGAGTEEDLETIKAALA